jgi:hypothetical protein
MTIQPWMVTKMVGTVASPARDLRLSFDAVPAGKILVVQYVSGTVTIPKANELGAIFCGPNFASEGAIWLQALRTPVVDDFGGQLGLAQTLTFNAPITMYLTPSEQFTMLVQTSLGVFSVSAVGQFVNQ